MAFTWAGGRSYIKVKLRMRMQLTRAIRLRPSHDLQIKSVDIVVEIDTVPTSENDHFSTTD
jgi:hypothetical protein